MLYIWQAQQFYERSGIFVKSCSQATWSSKRTKDQTMKPTRVIPKNSQLYLFILYVLYCAFSWKMHADIDGDGTLLAADMVAKLFTFFLVPYCFWCLVNFRKKSSEMKGLSFNIILTLFFVYSLNGTLNMKTAYLAEHKNNIALFQTKMAAAEDAISKPWLTSYQFVKQEVYSDLPSLENDEKAAQYTQAIDRYISLSEEYGKYYSTLPETAAQELSSLKIADVTKNSIVQDYRQTISAERKKAFSELVAIHVQYGRSTRDLVSFLHDNKNAWETEDGKILFTSQETLDSFNSALEPLVKIEEEIEKQTAVFSKLTES